MIVMHSQQDATSTLSARIFTQNVNKRLKPQGTLAPAHGVTGRRQRESQIISSSVIVCKVDATLTAILSPSTPSSNMISENSSTLTNLTLPSSFDMPGICSNGSAWSHCTEMSFDRQERARIVAASALRSTGLLSLLCVTGAVLGVSRWRDCKSCLAASTMYITRFAIPCSSFAVASETCVSSKKHRAGCGPRLPSSATRSSLDSLPDLNGNFSCCHARFKYRLGKRRNGAAVCRMSVTQHFNLDIELRLPAASRSNR